MEYSIHPNKKVIYITFTGSIDANSLIYHILTIRSDPYFQDGFNVIIDLTKTIIPNGFMELAEVAEFVRATSVVRETFKMAILVETPEQLRSANLYALLVKQNHLLVCTNREDAKQWVAISTGAETDIQTLEHKEQ